MILKNVKRYPNKYFSKQYITHESVFFQFCDMGRERYIFYSPRFLWSTCIQAGSWILHREKKSCSSIGSCQRILYRKILHCMLIGISMPLLTHVLRQFLFTPKNIVMMIHRYMLIRPLAADWAAGVQWANLPRRILSMLGSNGSAGYNLFIYLFNETTIMVRYCQCSLDDC